MDWTRRTLGATNSLYSVTWSGSQFVVVGDSGTILTSPEGIHWTKGNSGATEGLNAVIYSGRLFVAAGASGTILTSADGINWTRRRPSTTGTLSAVTWSGSQFVAVGASGTILTSTDGIDWTKRNSGTAENLYDVTWSGNLFVIVGDRGTNLRSADGIGWTGQTTGSGQSYYYGVAWSGSQFVAVGYSGAIMTSPNGISWTSRTANTANKLNAVTWNGTQFAVVGDAGAILTCDSNLILTTQPTNKTIPLGGTATFSVVATSVLPLTYQWQKDGKAMAGATNATFTVTSVKAGDVGSYSVKLTNSYGALVSTAATLALGSSRISNLSVRTTLTNGETLTVGFVTAGAKRLLLRAVGPGLVPFGVASGYFADPKLTIISSTGVAVAQNDNWNSSLSTTFSSVGAFPLIIGSTDAALLQLISGPSTAQVNGTGSGLVLTEVYDTESASTARLTNVSARNQVGTGANILIAGFVVDGNASKTLLIRGVGPALRDIWGIPGALADPKLEIYKQDGTIIAENDNWSSNLVATFNAVAAFPFTTGSKDAALLVTLSPGAYTAQVSGVGNTTGDGIVELYEVP